MRNLGERKRVNMEEYMYVLLKPAISQGDIYIVVVMGGKTRLLA